MAEEYLGRLGQRAGMAEECLGRLSRWAGVPEECPGVVEECLGPAGKSLDRASAKSFLYNEVEEELTSRGNGSSIDGRCQGED
jgi:hypothetical protein